MLLFCNFFQCPVFDSEENVQYGNFYQTMTYQAGITVRVSMICMLCSFSIYINTFLMCLVDIKMKIHFFM